MWSKITGHPRQIEELRRALASGRLPNAYLFSGPRGVGKRMTANALAAALACTSGGADACGACAGCRKVAARNHPDVFTVEPEAIQPGWEPPPGKDKKPSEEIKIEQVRDLQSQLQFHPLEARAKLAVVDEADRMTEATANSLLKIIEEPPQATHFVLISAAPHALLPTIRSRCRRVEFGPLAEEDVALILSEGGRASLPQAMMIARLSGGSVGGALAIDPEFVVEVMNRFTTLRGKASGADIIQTAEGWSHSEASELRLIFDLLASWYRDCLRYRTTGDNSSLIHPDAARAAELMPIQRAERAISEIAAARRTLETTANKQLMFEHLLFTLTS
ncbi:MAG: DNA polymerase III subunit delta' [Pseudomonadota bacterium]